MAEAKPLLHFAHGNGFPSACYRKYFRYLADDYDVQFIGFIGHDPLFPVTDNWDNLVDELIANVKRTCAEPAVGVGHSLGGVLTLRASLLEPDLFTHVILLDSPLLGRVKTRLLGVMKNLGLIDHITPARTTKFRRQHWPNQQAALEYLQTREFFQDFDPDCLRDYVAYGLDYTAQGYSLKFSREVEYQIYRTLPHVYPRQCRKVERKMAMIYGEHSDLIQKSDLKALRKNFNMRLVEFNGGHMFPLENPEQAAVTTMQTIEELSSQ